MHIQVYQEPSIEPVTLAELRTFLNLDSGTFSGNMTLYTSIAAGEHAVTTGYTLLGTAVNVQGRIAVVYLQPVNNGAGGTVDVKIQESYDGTTWTDWAGGAFTQVTEANDTVIQEKQYTGDRTYIRTVAKTLGAACEFGTSVMVWEPEVSEDDLLTELITTARLQVENDLGRKLITQTIDYYPEDWPNGDRMKLPYGNLQSVDSVTYKDYDGTETTLTEDTDYYVETNGSQCGALVLPEDKLWPAVDLYPSNPIQVRYVCGYGDAAADVPAIIKQAIKRLAANYYMNRGDDSYGATKQEDTSYRRIIARADRLWDADFK